MPHEKPIREYWAEHPLNKHLNQSDYTPASDGRPCMACGGYGNERAHILALSQNGTNLPSNHHMLCSICHFQSEMLQGHVYWLWLVCKSTIFHGGTDMTYEMDWTSDEDKTLRKYCYSPEYTSKLKEYAKEYEWLSYLEGWKMSYDLATMMLSNPSKFGFKFEPVDIDELDKITEYVDTDNDVQKIKDMWKEVREECQTQST